MGVASQCYKRALFLGSRAARDRIILLSEAIEAPYLVKRLLLGNNSIQKLSGSTFGNTIRACALWDDYLDFWRIGGYDRGLPDSFRSLEAIVNYYMGDSIRAHEIFNGEDQAIPLSLRDLYYHTLCGADFLEPVEGILASALLKIERDGVKDDIDRYYAGRMYAMAQEYDTALAYFGACGEFLPALLASAGVLHALQDRPSLVRVATAIERVGAGTNYLGGNRRIELKKSDAPDTYYGQMGERFFYYELLYEINIVREVLKTKQPYDHQEFGRLIAFEDAFRRELDFAPRYKELEVIQAELMNRMAAYADEWPPERLQHEIAHNTTATDLLEDIDKHMAKATPGPTAEVILAMRIFKQKGEPYWYKLCILDYHSKGAYDLQTALRLWIYLEKILILRGNKPSPIETLGPDLLTAIFHIPFKVIYRTLGVLLESVHLNLEQESPSRDESLDYTLFKEQYYQNLGFVLEHSAHLLDAPNVLV